MQLKINDTIIYFEEDLNEINDFKNQFNLNKYYLIVDSNVYNLYKDVLDKHFINNETIIIPSGEEYKNINTVFMIVDKLLNLDINRGDTIIGIGGGVTCDICGFVASILYRGIKHLLIPTTLLAMVDATMGGKCGVDHLNRKNIIGSFYEPKGIYITPYFLKTLPKEQYNSGLGEVIKYSFLDDRFDLYNECNLINIIKDSILIKKKYVEADFKDKGLRMCLNLGHTFGHAIELKEKILHGQAVLEGIYMIFNLEKDLGYNIDDEQDLFNKLLVKYNLEIKGYDYKLYIEDIYKDKKNISGELNLVFVKNFRPYLYKIRKDELYDKIIGK